MELLRESVGPLSTNVYVLADERTREAIAIDTATPCVAWLTGLLAQRHWALRLIVSTHGHWDHIGDNAAVQAWTREQAAHRAEYGGGVAGTTRTTTPVTGEGTAGAAAVSPRADAGTLDAAVVGSSAQDAEAEIAVHRLDRDRLVHPPALFAPFAIPPSVPAVELVEGGRVRFGEIALEVLHTPGHTEGSVCLFEPALGLLLSGDTLFAGSWGRTDLPGGSDAGMAESLARLAELEDRVRVLPGHGPATTIGRERAWLDLVRRSGRLPM